MKTIDYSKLSNICKEFKKEDLHMVLQKGIYPYEWVDQYSKFECLSLPTNLEDWFSNLTDKTKSNFELKHSQKFFYHFKFRTFGEYHNLYLKLDTVLLQDVFENFRKEIYDNYKIDPAYYILAPNFADAASLKMTGQKLELITDEKMYNIYEKGIRGGISQISHRSSIANNCYFYDEKIGKTIKLSKEKAIEKGIFNSKKHISYVMYLDANNLYGHCLSKPLPIGQFKDYNMLKKEKSKDFMKLKKIDRNFIFNLKDYDKFGYTFFVDLEIPKELHDNFKDYPLLPEHTIPNKNELSDYQKDLVNRNIGHQSNVGKILCTLYYVIDYRMLKECLLQGVILKKVKNSIRFEQKAWLKPFIRKEY